MACRPRKGSGRRPPGATRWGRPSDPPSLWERYAQKPLTPCTSTLMEGGVSSIVVAYDERSGDYWCDFALACWLLQMASTARIYEIDGPESWHNLCLCYPAEGDDDDRLVPNRGAAAADWVGWNAPELLGIADLRAGALRIRGRLVPSRNSGMQRPPSGPTACPSAPRDCLTTREVRPSSHRTNPTPKTSTLLAAFGNSMVRPIANRNRA